MLLLLVIGFRLECLTIDSLHAIDLGTAAHIVGNTFWETIANRMWGKPNQDENCAALEAAPLPVVGNALFRQP